MTGRLVAALGRSSRTTRRLTLAALALVVLLVVASALAPSPQPAHRPVAPLAGPTRTRSTPTAPGSRAISRAGLGAAKRAAARFLTGYLRFLYGRGSARSVAGATPDLRRQLIRVRALVTPVERHRDPRVVSLTAVRQAPAAVLATALVADGGVTAYALRMVLRSGRDGWLVSSVDGG
ncbi:MAG: hypothetical protein JO243_12385 [Solirubrobacterales bacterium]|nr:hypothetical protein [Solirubrobacterales bacterium]